MGGLGRVNYRTLSVPDLVDKAKAGDNRAVGRLLTLVERGGTVADEIAELTHPLRGNAHVVGVTGPPGAGKSTLVGRLVAEWVERGHRPAVLAIDPSSPISGGAILGDRIRMDDVVPEGTFVRSMATRGHQGGLALAVPGAVRVLDAAGFSPVIVETVGVGQVEVDVVAAADPAVVVTTPGMGDAVQANKAGLLEVADVFVINKADRPGASDTRRDLQLMLDLAHVTGQDIDQYGTYFRPEVVMSTATSGEGAPATVDEIHAHMDHLNASGGLNRRRALRIRAEVRSRAEQILLSRLEDELEGTDLLEAADPNPVATAESIVDRIAGES
ncbi:MAG: methylmalonyl Co-A mutase-associated GTPase MeaB [Acidimicrobiales bacterium]|nr:methylmalonyl Co-A mutase-associated GTPase MeaB [Acidimicrobiales bacterium]